MSPVEQNSGGPCPRPSERREVSLSESSRQRCSNNSLVKSKSLSLVTQSNCRPGKRLMSPQGFPTKIFAFGEIFPIFACLLSGDPTQIFFCSRKHLVLVLTITTQRQMVIPLTNGVSSCEKQTRKPETDATHKGDRPLMSSYLSNVVPSTTSNPSG